MKYTMEQIEWYDHSAPESLNWKHFDDIPLDQVYIVESVGYVIHETDDEVILGSSVCFPAKKTAGYMCIIKSAIKERTVIEGFDVTLNELDG